MISSGGFLLSTVCFLHLKVLGGFLVMTQEQPLGQGSSHWALLTFRGPVAFCRGLSWVPLGRGKHPQPLIPLMLLASPLPSCAKQTYLHELPTVP